MGIFSRQQSAPKLDWNPLISEADVELAMEQSYTQPVLFFKHSTRCSISSMALSRFEKNWNDSLNCACYFLDLIAYRSVSNFIEESTKVTHQSPQCILIWKGEVIYDASHNGIDALQIASIVNNTNSNE